MKQSSDIIMNDWRKLSAGSASEHNALYGDTVMTKTDDGCVNRTAHKLRHQETADIDDMYSNPEEFTEDGNTLGGQFETAGNE